MYYIPEFTSIPLHANHVTMFYDMLDEYNSYHELTEIILTGMLMRLLIFASRHKILETPVKLQMQQENSTIREALIYIASQNEEISLKQVASHVGLAPTYFSRLFKQTTGTTYTEYITISKILYARNLMMQTKMNLNEIALCTGFSNGNYLSTIFHKHFGMTPSAYKHKYASTDMYPDWIDDEGTKS